MNQDATTADNFIEQRRTYQVGPGPSLRHAREEAGLSIEDVAAQLRLSPQLILDIEDDNYNNMMFTFTRGYLRAYARLLELSAEEIVTAFNALELSETPRPQSPLAQGVGKGAKLKDRQSSVSHEKIVRWISFLVVLALLVSVGLWWHSQNSSVSIPLTHLLGSHSVSSTAPTPPTTVISNNSAGAGATSVNSTSAANNIPTAVGAATNANASTSANATMTTQDMTAAAATSAPTPAEMNDGDSNIQTSAAPAATAVAPTTSANNTTSVNNVTASTDPTVATASTSSQPAQTADTTATPAVTSVKPAHHRYHSVQSASNDGSYGEIVPEPYSSNTSNND